MATAELTKNYDELQTIINESSDEEVDECVVEKNKRGSERKYLLKASFTTLDKAREHVLSKKVWRYVLTKTTTCGKKYFYRCNATTKRGKQCSTGLFILLPANNLTFEIYETECEQWFR